MMAAVDGEGALGLWGWALVAIGWAFILACLVAAVVLVAGRLRRKK